jgi:glycosyltransferase involved in cell wall biosynthesis
MDGGPLVSVVVPCHGHAVVLREALQSIAAQTHRPLEIVVVDDADPDGARVAATAREFGAGYIRHDVPRLAAAARNDGIATTTGRYVLPVDADDVLAPTYVAKAVAALEADPEAGVAYCILQAFGTESWIFGHAVGWTLADLLADNRIGPGSLFRRRCWEEVGGYADDVPGYEDWDLWLAIAARGWRFVQIPEFLYFYRLHGANSGALAKPHDAEYRARMAARHGAAAAAATAPISAVQPT